MSMSTREIVAAVKAEFPRFDRTLYVKAGRSQEYGIRLVDRAQEIVNGKPLKTPRSHGKTGSPCRLSCRVEESIYGAVHKAVKRHGYAHIADYLIAIITKALEAENGED